MNPISRLCSPVLTKIFRIDRLALVICAFAAPALSAAEFPAPPQDPRLAEVYVQARALLDKSLSPGYMDSPDAAKPWPCAVADLEIRRLAGALGDDDLQKIAAENKTVMRKSGNMTSSVRDVRYAPVSASCKDGKLDGPLEFAIEFTQVLDTYKYVGENRYRKRIITGMTSGKYAAGTPTAQSELHVSSATKYKDPGSQKRMAKYHLAHPFKKVLFIHYAVPVQVGGKTTYYTVGFRKTEGGVWETTLGWPTGPGRSSLESYEGAALSSTMRFKNNKSHGESRRYEVTPGGKSVLKSTKCYEDGEEIKTTDCKVD